MRWYAIAGEGSDATCSPPPALRVAVTHRLRRAPQRSTAAAFHRVPAGHVTFYSRLTVHHPELRAPLRFCLRDRHHGALVSHRSCHLEGSFLVIFYCQQCGPVHNWLAAGIFPAVLGRYACLQ